jgi:hypothetical protein
MYDFVYLSVRRSVRDSHWSRDYRDGTGIRVFYENPGFYRGDWASKWAGPTGLGPPAWAHFGPSCGLLCPVLLPESSRVFPQLHVGPCRQFLFGLDEAPCPARFSNFLTRSSEFSIFSGLVLGLLGVWLQQEGVLTTGYVVVKSSDVVVKRY